MAILRFEPLMEFRIESRRPLVSLSTGILFTKGGKKRKEKLRKDKKISPFFKAVWLVAQIVCSLTVLLKN